MSDGLPGPGTRVVVAGAGTSGRAAASALRELGALVTVVDASEERRTALEAAGFDVLDVDHPPEGTGLVVTSPGWRPDSPLLVAAAAAGIEVIGEVELAWRLRPPGAAPWLAVTGTNGKTTTVKLLEAMLRAAGHRAVAAGNVGLPLVDAVLATEPYDVLAVELSSFQLHWSQSVQPHSAAVLNIADDHTDWHGSVTAYAADKARIWGPRGRRHGQPDLATAVANADDAAALAMLAMADARRRVSYTVAPPRAGQLGLVEGLLVDRAFPDVGGEATELATLPDLTISGPHNVGNALAAAALARSFGVAAADVRQALRGFHADPHRNQHVALVDGVSWVDDSKATNPHAAAASLAAYPRVVWVAGGLLKGADVDGLVASAVGRLRAVVLLGTDREELARSLRRHAPDVPVFEVSRLDTLAMSEAVFAARRFAVAGDTVLLAPAAASMDCFRDYAERGELFTTLARQSA